MFYALPALEDYLKRTGKKFSLVCHCGKDLEIEDFYDDEEEGASVLTFCVKCQEFSESQIS